MRNTSITAALIVGGSIAIAGFLLAQSVAAQTVAQNAGASSSANITFPVAELGNCSSQSACKTYCDDASHMQACIAFAKNHNIIDETKATQEEQFAKTLQAGGGPGGCTSQQSCESYCSNIDHIKECIAFAQQHGIQNEQTSQAEKIQSYLQSGGTMPGGCTSQESCQSYCGILSHMQECMAFAQKIGINPQNGGGNGNQMTAEQIQKFAELAQQGKTPGGCTTNEACRTYCNDPSHGEECSNFAQELGLSSVQEGHQQPGPGGCTSSDSCAAYCNIPAHSDECIAFAKDHGLMSPQDATNMQNGLQQMRVSFQNMSPDTESCIGKTVGEDTLSQMKDGQFTPTPDIMTKIQACFGQPKGINDILKNASPDILTCVQNSVGDKLKSLEANNGLITQDMGNAIRTCFQSLQGKMTQGKPGPQGPGGPQGGFEGQPGPGGPGQGPEQRNVQGSMMQDNFRGFNGTGTPPEGPGNMRPPFPNSSSSQNFMQGNFNPQEGPQNQMPPNGQQPPQGQIMPPTDQQQQQPQQPPTSESGGNLLGAFQSFTQSLGGILNQ